MTIATNRATARRSQATPIEGGRQTTEAQTKAYREARALQKGAYIDQRRFISDPPTEYRQVDDAGKAR